MRFSLHLVPDDLDQLVRRARFAEEHGFEEVWVAESHLTCRDHLVALTLAAVHTATVRLGPGVTNPVLHDASVLACGIATLDEVSRGRAVFGIGSGDTPVYSLGRTKASLGRLREAIGQIRGLLAGDLVEYAPGVRIKLWCRRPIPIYLAAEGPRTLQLAAEVADGAIIGSGILPDTLAWVDGHLRAGMAGRPRSLGPLDRLHAAIISVDRDGRRAREAARARVANRAHHNFRATLESVPVDRRPEVQRLLDQFDVKAWRHPKHAPLVTDYILDRFAVAGTPEQVVERLHQLARCGVSRLMIDPPADGFDETLDLFAREVLPNVAEAAAP